MRDTVLTQDITPLENPKQDSVEKNIASSTGIILQDVPFTS